MTKTKIPEGMVNNCRLKPACQPTEVGVPVPLVTILSIVKKLSSLMMIALFLSHLASCAYLASQGHNPKVDEVAVIITIELPFNAGKTAWSSYDNTFYFADFSANEINIYRGDKRVNRIGGLGFSSDNFNKLSDITVSETGKLLALDALLKQIKQFDEKGKLVNIHQLDFTQQPVLFDVGRTGVIYIYDAALDEILIIDENLEEVIHRFGKFYFNEPVLLVSNRNSLTVYDQAVDKTFVFSNFGELKAELTGFRQIDRFDNRYQLTAGNVTVNQEDQLLILNDYRVNSFMVKGNYLFYQGDGRVTLARILYQQRKDD